jgi:hypothetical protein
MFFEQLRKSSYCFIRRDGFTVFQGFFLGLFMITLLEVLQTGATSPNMRDLPQDSENRTLTRELEERKVLCSILGVMR